jgi:transcriptional regulator
VLFHGPHAYVSPRWYATPGLVPTWNYALAQVSGTARLLPDAADVTRILQQLVQVFEGDAWSLDQVSQLPKLLPMIVGLEIDIDDTQAKFKLSQNRSPADINAVATALAHSPDGQAQATAALMARHAGAVLPDTHE